MCDNHALIATKEPDAAALASAQAQLQANQLARAAAADALDQGQPKTLPSATERANPPVGTRKDIAEVFATSPVTPAEPAEMISEGKAVFASGKAPQRSDQRIAAASAAIAAFVETVTGAQTSTQPAIEPISTPEPPTVLTTPATVEVVEIQPEKAPGTVETPARSAEEVKLIGEVRALLRTLTTAKGENNQNRLMNELRRKLGMEASSITAPLQQHQELFGKKAMGTLWEKLRALDSTLALSDLPEVMRTPLQRFLELAKTPQKTEKRGRR